MLPTSPPGPPTSDDAIDSFRFSDVVNRADVGVIERRRSFRFADESPHPAFITCECLRQDFQCHDPIQPGIQCSINFSHSTDAEQRQH